MSKKRMRIPATIARSLSPRATRKIPPNIREAAQTVSKERQRAIPYAPTDIKPAQDRQEEISPVVNARNQHTDIYTLITQIGNTRLLYSADSWVKITLNLETAGPVSVSTRQKLTPVLSGRGILLITDEPYTFNLPKGDRLFYSSNTINRVRVTIAPVPWLEQLLLNVEGIFSAILKR